jgi:hypothetical protein
LNSLAVNSNFGVFFAMTPREQPACVIARPRHFDPGTLRFSDSMIFSVVANVSLKDLDFGNVKLSPIRPRRHAGDPFE